jgi:hypothetical protein
MMMMIIIIIIDEKYMEAVARKAYSGFCTNNMARNKESAGLHV